MENSLVHERWKPITGFEHYYEVSTLGRVRRIKAGRRTKVGNILSVGKTTTPSSRYARVLLSVKGKYTMKRIHKLVAEAFIGPCPEGKEVNHKDLNRSNNCYKNLEYITHKKNIKHAIRHGLFHITKRKSKIQDVRVFKREIVKALNLPNEYRMAWKIRCIGEFLDLPTIDIKAILMRYAYSLY